MTAPEIWTIGHWNYTENEFVELLLARDVELLIDVRSFPGSRRSPQYGKERMMQWLPAGGVDYLHLPEVGGRRKAQHVDDPNANAGWRLASFRNYADYTLTEEWRVGMESLRLHAKSHRTAIMCGEPTPWRCHRSIISTWLVANGWAVHHIIGTKLVDHQLGKWGPSPRTDRIGLVTYPAPMQEVA